MKEICTIAKSMSFVMDGGSSHMGVWTLCPLSKLRCNFEYLDCVVATLFMQSKQSMNLLDILLLSQVDNCGRF